MVRRTIPDEFERIVAAVEEAKAQLVATVPSPRGIPGRPVAEALMVFEAELRRAVELLDHWQPAAPVLLRACVGAIDESLRRAERLRLEAPALDYEGLVTVLGDLMAPLDAFVEVERALRSGGGQSASRRWPESSSGTS